jgi:hypothetical protein
MSHTRCQGKAVEVHGRGGWRRVLKSSQDVVFIPALLTLHNFGQVTCCQVLEWQEISGCWEKPGINTDIIVKPW